MPTQLNVPLLKSRLMVRGLLSQAKLTQNHPQTAALLEAAGLKPGQLRHHAAKLLASGAVAGAILLSPGQATATPQLVAENRLATVSSFDIHRILAKQLQSVLPEQVQALNQDQEDRISQVLQDILGLKASAALEGEKLNQSYGQMGAEQHLLRFPGDSLDQHAQYLKEGIAPGRGAWGYFAWSKDQLTPDLIKKEEYYFAVQTLYLPDWQARLAHLRDWYKYRKMIAINPVNGKAVVGVVGDAGPAQWTGKHFGGSPEIMAYLELNVGKQKGPVVLFFVDDPQNQVPLGPVDYNLQKGKPLLSKL